MGSVSSLLTAERTPVFKSHHGRYRGRQTGKQRRCLRWVNQPSVAPPTPAFLSYHFETQPQETLFFNLKKHNNFSYFQSVANALALTTWLVDPSIFCRPLPRYVSLSSFHHADSPHTLSIIAFSPQVVFIEQLRMHWLLPSAGPMQVFPPWFSLCTLSPPTSASPPRRRPAVCPSIFSGDHACAPLTCFLLACFPFSHAASFYPARLCSLLIGPLPSQTPALCDSW